MGATIEAFSFCRFVITQAAFRHSLKGAFQRRVEYLPATNTGSARPGACPASAFPSVHCKRFGLSRPLLCYNPE